MSSIAKLNELLRAAGRGAWIAGATGSIHVEAGDGSAIEIMASEEPGVPDEFGFVALSSIFYRRVGTGENTTIDLAPASDEFLNELITANDQSGIAVFGCLDIGPVPMDTFVCRAQVSLRAMTPDGLVAILSSMAKVTLDSQRRLNNS